MKLTPVGDRALTISHWPGTASPAALADALTAAMMPGVADVFAAFDTVTVLYDAVAFPLASPPIDQIAAWVDRLATGHRGASRQRESRLIELPVSYGGASGPDLVEVAARIGWSAERVVKAHAAGEYHVAAVGFLPGFAYLSGLPPNLKLPRRQTPRLSVPPGSVALGGPYTGVYPVASPGGWHLIGRTPLTLFDPAHPTTGAFRVGDRVRFVPA